MSARGSRFRVKDWRTHRLAIDRIFPHKRKRMIRGGFKKRED